MPRPRIAPRRLHAATRVHLAAPANPATAEIRRFGFATTRDYLDAVRAALPAPLRLTCDEKLLEAEEDPVRGGRRDDDARARDLQRALGDPRTAAIVASNGGAYLTRILPRLDFSPLSRRSRPLTVFGFSEITGLVNLAAACRGARGVYWLCPNYLAWKVTPPAAARAAFAEFWRGLPRWIDGRRTGPTRIEGELVRGTARGGVVRVTGGCLSVLAGMLAGTLGRRLRPAGRWLAIEDVNEAPYRIDRWLAALQLAGWFERVAGVLVGDFHTREDRDQRAAVVELLAFHAPRGLPIVTTRAFGHVWPMAPLPIQTPLTLTLRGRRVTFSGGGGAVGGDDPFGPHP